MTNPAPTGGDEGPDPFAVDETPPPATPTAPVYDALAEETPLTPEVDYALAPDPTAAGPLAQVKAFAADKPAVFVGVALAAGWLVGKIFSSSDD